MEEIYTRFEDYLDGRMDAGQRAGFEAELQADAELAEAFALAREARERLGRRWASETADAGLTATLTRLGERHFGGGAQSRRPWVVRRWPWLAAAASVALLLVWLVWPPAERRLYARYRDFPEASFTTRAGEPADDGLAEAAAAFNRGDYAAALPAFERRAAARPDDLEARLFAAFCLLELGRTAEARAVFSQIGATPNAWAGEAKWFLALSFLPEKDREQCAAALRAIGPGEPHYAEAQQLLQKLEN